MKLIDVSVPIDANLATYPGHVPFGLDAATRLADGAPSNLSTLRMSVHTGTHVDAPRHLTDDGSGVDALPLDMLCGRTRVVELTTRRGVTAEDLASFDLREDLRLLLKTRNSTFWGDPAFHDNYVGVTENGARYLVDCGVKVVGVDYLSVEPFNTPGSPAHHILLGAGTIVIEGLNLRDVEPGTYDMFCLPLAIAGADGAPARVVLRRS